MTTRRFLAPGFLLLCASLACAQDGQTLTQFLSKPILAQDRLIGEIQRFVDPKVPRLGKFDSAEAWAEHADGLRRDVLEKVVFRGEAAKWRDAKAGVEWLETIEGGEEYRIKKVRYEAVPGMWIPALLYEPYKLPDKAPVHLAVNGHDGAGKAAGYKQTRCINLAKRGTIVLNVEWVGMGQLRATGFSHARMNQLDLCGTSGLAPFYLSMKRGIDILLSHPNADPARVGVSGLSGGGWQTIFISALDTRVTLSNPVAGYSSYLTRLRHFKDLGDSEQTPSDLATVVDYVHLTAMRAPRPTLLTYNSKDQCCFESGYALPPLLEGARPIFRLFQKEGQPEAIRAHVNHDPGTHNFEIDNRQALYRMVGDFFHPGDAGYSAEEIPCKDEIKTREVLDVKLPENNQDFNSLATALAKELPRCPSFPEKGDEARNWQGEQREILKKLVKIREYPVKAERVSEEEKAGVKATCWKLQAGEDWTIPVVELVSGEPKGTAVLLNDAGRKADPVTAGRLLKAGYRVLAADVYYFGEAHPATHDYLFSLIIAAVGERPLGVQASQVGAVARWAGKEFGQPVTVHAVGPRLSMVALVAAACDEQAVAGLELHGALASLKEVIEQNRAVNQVPELFCFGLLEALDVPQFVALVAPRPVTFVEPSDRARQELGGLRSWYKVLGKEHDVLGK